MSLELVIWCIYIGFVVASVMSLYYKRFLGAFVRKLLEEEAFTPDKALTLGELGFENNSIIKSQLKSGGVFSSIVFMQEDEIKLKGDSAVPVYHDSIDFSTARFYIPYELRIRAELKFSHKGTHVMGVVIAIILFFILALIATIFGGPAIEWAKAIIGG